MADQNLSTKAQDPEPARRPFNEPGLSPEGFLLAVMHEDTLSMSLRVKAAAALTSVQSKAPQPPITIHIRDALGHEYLTKLLGSGAVGLMERTEISSQKRESSHIAPTLTGEGQGPSNFETITSPLSPAEIQQIKAAVQALRPDADLSQTPDHLTLCECGHWMLFPCRCARVH